MEDINAFVIISILKMFINSKMQSELSYLAVFMVVAITMLLFKKDWGIDEHTEHETVPLGNDKYMFVYNKDGRLCLDTFHPAQRTIPRGNYVDSIIKVINDFKK